MINFAHFENRPKLNENRVNISIVDNCNMSRTNTDVIDLLKTLCKDMEEVKLAIKELQEDNAQAAIGAEKMYKTLNAKFDLFKNLEEQSRETIQQGSSSTRKLTRPAFFKKMFLEEREKYLNTLYTQEEIDAAYQDKDVIAKKKDTEKAAKVVTILYNTHIKANNPEGRLSAFESLYQQSLNVN